MAAYPIPSSFARQSFLDLTYRKDFHSLFVALWESVPGRRVACIGIPHHGHSNGACYAISEAAIEERARLFKDKVGSSSRQISRAPSDLAQQWIFVRNSQALKTNSLSGI